MKNKCKNCGMCCIIVPTGFTKKHLKKHNNSIEAKFFIKNFKRISKDKVKKILPSLTKVNSYYYECKLFNHNTKMCPVHGDKKPAMCKDYPYYDNKSTDDIEFRLLGSFCGFSKEK